MYHLVHERKSLSTTGANTTDTLRSVSDDPRRDLLERVMHEVALHGLADRSLRDIGTAIGSSHRMLHYHFGSRDGLVAAIVAEMEPQQRRQLRDLATTTDDPSEIMRQVWSETSSPPLRPFVRLFFEALTQALAERPGTEGFLESLTDGWLDDGAEITAQLSLADGPMSDRVDLRLGVAVTRGLLIDVLASGDAGPATEAYERFIELVEQSGR